MRTTIKQMLLAILKEIRVHQSMRNAKGLWIFQIFALRICSNDFFFLFFGISSTQKNSFHKTIHIFMVYLLIF